MQASALSVSDLNEYVRRSLAGDPMLHNIAVRGEISNFRPYASGHWYFSLKDEGSRIACVMFRQYNQALGFMPRDGMKVVLRGSAGLYVSAGSYQFYAEGLSQDGLGELYQRFLALRDSLQKEGLFDPALKRPLPLLPRAVGIVTSGSGAVLHDIVTVTRRRFPGMPLILRPSQVQGEGAREDLARALREIGALPQVDVVIIGRGGGSLEDLWAFNEEEVVRAIAACPKPVISAVGHETDTTLADYAADMRAPTPSAAAELAVPDRRELLSRIEGLATRLYQGGQNRLLRIAARVQAAEKGLRDQDPGNKLRLSAQRLMIASTSLVSLVQQALSDRRARLRQFVGSLSALGPAQTLRRGYVIAMDGAQPVTSALLAPPEMSLQFHDGALRVRTLGIDREKTIDRQEN